MPKLRLSDATMLHYETCGAGPPLLAVHGLGSSGDDWAFQRDAFAAAHRLILPDLRGSGRSDKPRGRYSIAGFAEDLAQLLDALGVDAVDVVGFSLGGAVAIELALRHPQRVRRLVVCNTLANYRTDTPRKWLEARLQIALVRTIGLRRTAGLVARRMFPHDDQAPKRRRVVDVVGANDRAAYLATVRALIGWSALERLARLRAPTLVIAAEHDYTPLSEKRAELARYPDARLVVIPGSRHGTPFDAIEAFNAAVLAFLGAAPREEIAPDYQGSVAPA
jgi:3-oxoadipate enol-lactonase